MARQIAEARKHAEDHDKRERERVERERPDRAPDHRQLQDETRRAALRHEATLGVRNDAGLTNPAERLAVTQNPALTRLAHTAEVAAASEPQLQQTRANLASRFGPTPEPTQPQQRTAVETPAPPTPTANPPAVATVKTADATPPARQQTTPPRMASPTARA